MLHRCLIAWHEMKKKSIRKEAGNGLTQREGEGSAEPPGSVSGMSKSKSF